MVDMARRHRPGDRFHCHGGLGCLGPWRSTTRRARLHRAQRSSPASARRRPGGVRLGPGRGAGPGPSPRLRALCSADGHRPPHHGLAGRPRRRVPTEPGRMRVPPLRPTDRPDADAVEGRHRRLVTRTHTCGVGRCRGDPFLMVEAIGAVAEAEIQAQIVEVLSREGCSVEADMAGPAPEPYRRTCRTMRRHGSSAPTVHAVPTRSSIA